MSEGNVQLKLQASLDLDFLRAQVASLGNSLKTGSVSVVATLDTEQLQKDVAKLGKEIGIKINDTALDATVDRIKTVEAQLKNLQSAENKVVVGVTAKSAVTQKDARKVRSGVYRSIMENGGKIMLPVGLQPISETAVNAFKADLRKKLGSINIKVDAAVGAMPTAGQAGASRRPSYLDAPAFKTELEKLSRATFAQLQKGASGLREGRTRAELERLLSQFAQTNPQGAQRTRDLNALREMLAHGRYQQGVGIEARMANGGGQSGQFQRTLDTFARGLFRMLGMDPAQLRAEEQSRRAAAARAANVPTPFGLLPSVTRRTQTAQGVNAIMQGTGAAGGEDPAGKLALSAETLRRRVDAILAQHFRAIEAQVREEFGGADLRQSLNAFAYMAQALKDAEQKARSARLGDAVNSFLRRLIEVVRLSEAQLRIDRTQVRDLGSVRQPMLLGREQLALPPAGTGRTPQPYSGMAGDSPSWQERAAARTAQAYARSALRGIEFAPPSGSLPPFGGSGGGRDRVTGSGQPSPGRGGQIVPYGPRTELPSGYFAGGQMAKALREADQYLRQARVPLAGAIRELGGEFAQATKQVLLYGTAYKALAFFMDLPSQALNAATALQTFRNQLNAITGSAENANRSFGFVDNLADRFSVPLESARTGFVRLYASMAPAGFDASQIENLFTGISKAAATLGLSRDQVDRVTYAFSQMASKGQLMAEEVTGQLGDVIPGALSLMAEAAQMDIPTFKKAMEDGMFTGKAFAAVMANIPIVLERRFGEGAKGAAKTLRGSLNDMQNSLQLLYEAFEPLVGMAAQNVFPLISGAIKDATDATKAFSAAAQGNNEPAGKLSAQAKNIFDAMQRVAEIVKSLATIVKGIGPTLAGLGNALLIVTQQLARFINTPAGGFLANLAIKTALAMAALQLLARTGIVTAIEALIRFVAQTRATNAALAGTQLQFRLLASGATTAIRPVNLLTRALQSLTRFALITIAIEVVIQGWAEIARLKQSLEDISKFSSKDFKKQAETQTREVLNSMLIVNKRTQEQIEKEFDKFLFSKRGPSGLIRQALTGRDEELRARYQKVLIEEQVIRSVLPGAKTEKQKEAELQALPDNAADTVANDKAEKARQAALDKAQRDAERLKNQQQQRILQNAELRAKMQELDFGQRKTLLDEALDATKNAIDAEYDYKLSKANEIQAVQLRLEKQLAGSRLNAARSVENALLRMEEARLRTGIQQQRLEAAKQADALAPMQPSGGTLPMSMRVDLPAGAPAPLPLPAAQNAGAAQRLVQVANKNLGLFAGSTERCADAIRVLFKEAGIAIGVTKKAWDGLDSGSRLASSFFGSDIGQRIARQEDLRAGDLVGFERTYGDWGPGVQTHVGMYAGEGMMYDHSSRKGLVKRPMSTFAGKFMYGVRPAGLDGAAGTAAAPLSGPAFSVEKRAQNAEDDLGIARKEEEVAGIVALMELNNELQRATQQARVDIAQAIGATLPVEQLRLENELLAKRTDLMLQGVPDEVIEGEEKRLMALRQSEGLQALISDSINRTELTLSDYQKKLAEGGPNQTFYANAVKNTKENLAIKRAELARIGPELQRYNLEVLKNTLAELQNADALKKVRDTIETIERVVGDAMGSYKNFLVNVARGEGLTKSLKEFQNALRDQALTLFFDFAMKPMQKFMEDSLKGLFNVPIEDQIRQEQIRKLQEQIDATKANTAAITSNTNAQSGTTAGLTTSAVGAGDFAPFTGGIGRDAINEPFGVDLGAMVEAEEGIRATSESMYQLGATMPALGQGVGQLTQNFATSAIQSGAAAKTWQQSLGATVQSIGMAAGAVMSIAGGVSQIKEGGASNVLGGIGSIFMGIGGALGGLGKLGGLFGGGGGGGGGVSAPNIFSGLPTSSVSLGFAANGAVWKGGFSAFANGGMVTGPTLGLVGEGKYNEAIVPLPDGRSIPVKVAGGPSPREAMANGGMPSAGPSVMSFSFETTKINGVEYVSRDQLELAMAATRKEAAKEGAKRGMDMTMDKIRNSPAARQSIAMGRR